VREMKFPAPPTGPAIDFPFVGPDGNTYIWYWPAGMWTMVEPMTDELKQHWQDCLDDKTAMGTPEPPEYFAEVKRKR